MLSVDFVKTLPHRENLAGVDLDVGRLPLKAAGGLMHHDLGVGQREALAGGPSHQQQRSSGSGLPDADGRNVRPDVLHGVVHRQAGADMPAGRVDVEGDILLGILGLQEQQLRTDQAGDHVVDRAGQENDPLLQQARVDIVGALAPVGLLDHHRHQGVHRHLARVAHLVS